MTVASSETLSQAPHEQDADGISSQPPRRQHEASTPARRKIQGPLEKEGIGEVLACKALLGLGGMVLLLVAGTIIYMPEAMITEARAREFVERHKLKAANSVAEAVTTTLTETVVEYITATPIVSTSAARVTEVAGAVLIDTSTIPNVDSGTMLSILKYIVIALMFIIVAAKIMFLVVGLASLNIEAPILDDRLPIELMGQPVVNPREVPAGTGEREHPLAGIWAREELQVGERKRREQWQLGHWRQQEW